MAYEVIMDVIHFKSENADNELKSLFRSSQLIPFFGSGFTKGVRAKKGKIPDAEQLTKHITELASTKEDLTEKEIKEINDISSLKNAFGLLKTDDYIPAF
ncbi:hypothetical protein HA780_003371, partial [Salmonella enterica]|nr:hypothetical protein [Salmonella enterica]